jgi:hypothetical protein
MTVACIGALILSGVSVARWVGIEEPWVVALDAAPIVPLLLTGRGIQAQATSERLAVPWIMHAFRALRRVSEIHTVLWGRVAGARGAADELRVLVMPRGPLPGLVGIELGLAWSATPVGWTGTPEVLVRVRDASPAAVSLSRVIPQVRLLPGRRPDERVARLVPRTTARSCAVELMRTVAQRLTERRATRGTWIAEERRRETVLWPNIPMPLGTSSPGACVAANAIA